MHVMVGASVAPPRHVASRSVIAADRAEGNITDARPFASSAARSPGAADAPMISDIWVIGQGLGGMVAVATVPKSIVTIVPGCQPSAAVVRDTLKLASGCRPARWVIALYPLTAGHLSVAVCTERPRARQQVSQRKSVATAATAVHLAGGRAGKRKIGSGEVPREARLGYSSVERSAGPTVNDRRLLFPDH